MNVKLKCVDNGGQDWFTDGSDYDIIDNIDGKSFAVIDDFGELCIVNGNTGKWEIVE